jgi:hypothetical protein
MKYVYLSVFLIAIIASPIFVPGQKTCSAWVSTEFGVYNTWILNQNMHKNPEMNYSPKISYAYEISYKRFMDNYGLSVGLGVARLGQRYSGEISGTEALRRINLKYLEMPLMLIYKLGGSNRQTWISFGPQLLYLLSTQQDFDHTGAGPNSNTELISPATLDAINIFNQIDVMLAFELSNIFSSKSTAVFPFRNSRFAWTLSIVSAIGLTDINHKEFQNKRTYDLYQGSHNFYIGVRIGLMNKQVAKNAFSKRYDCADN